MSRRGDILKKRIQMLYFSRVLRNSWIFSLEIFWRTHIRRQQKDKENSFLCSLTEIWRKDADLNKKWLKNMLKFTVWSRMLRRVSTRTTVQFSELKAAEKPSKLLRTPKWRTRCTLSSVRAYCHWNHRSMTFLTKSQTISRLLSPITIEIGFIERTNAAVSDLILTLGRLWAVLVHVRNYDMLRYDCFLSYLDDLIDHLE